MEGAKGSEKEQTKSQLHKGKEKIPIILANKKKSIMKEESWRWSNPNAIRDWTKQANLCVGLLHMVGMSYLDLFNSKKAFFNIKKSKDRNFRLETLSLTKASTKILEFDSKITILQPKFQTNLRVSVHIIIWFDN